MKVYAVVLWGDGSWYSVFKTFKTREIAIRYCILKNFDIKDIIELNVLESIEEE